MTEELKREHEIRQSYYKAYIELKRERDLVDQEKEIKFLKSLNPGDFYFKLYYKQHVISYEICEKKAKMWEMLDYSNYRYLKKKKK